MQSAPVTPKKRTPRVSRTPQSGGVDRTTLPEEWAFLQEKTTPTKPRSGRKPSSPLSVLKDENWSVTESPNQGRTSTSFILERSDSTIEEEAFLKRFPIDSPENANDKAYREQKILNAIKSLQMQGLCFGFVTVLLSGPASDGHMEIVLEKGGDTLFNRKTMTLEELREILFQVFYALSVAQEHLKFVHYDLHDKNILVEEFSKGQGAKIELLDGSVYHMRRLLIKIADFALSRVEVGDEQIYNVKNPTRGAFDPNHDLMQFVDCLNRYSISDRSKHIQEMRLLKQLKAKMRNLTHGPRSLLQHEFFDPLKIRPVQQLEYMHSAVEEKSVRANLALQERWSPRLLKTSARNKNL